jgi:hypothetical protein
VAKLRISPGRLQTLLRKFAKGEYTTPRGVDGNAHGAQLFAPSSNGFENGVF